MNGNHNKAFEQRRNPRARGAPGFQGEGWERERAGQSQGTFPVENPAHVGYAPMGR